MQRSGSGSVAWLVSLVLVIVGLLGVASWAGYRLWTEIASRPPTPAPSAASAPSTPPVVAVVRPPTPGPDPPRAARLTPPGLTPQDAARTAEEAYADLWSALRRGDGATATKYVPAAKLATFQDEQAVVDDFFGISPLDSLTVSKATTKGDKAVILAKAASNTMTDSKGKPSPIDVVVRMAREDGCWRVLSQIWLVSTPPEKWQGEAMAWLAAPPASGPQARLEALGLRLDADSLQSAVARGDVEQVRLFLEAGLSAKTRMEDGMSLLSLALLGMPGKTESEEIAIALVRAGADVEEKTPTGMTPLMRAAFFCKPRVVSALIEAGARLDIRSGNGQTALSEAGNCPEAEALLRKAGAR